MCPPKVGSRKVLSTGTSAASSTAPAAARTCGEAHPDCGVAIATPEASGPIDTPASSAALSRPSDSPARAGATRTSSALAPARKIPKPKPPTARAATSCQASTASADAPSAAAISSTAETPIHRATPRSQILEATLRLVARDGFASVTLRDVAAEVGVVHGLIRHYFPTREQLVAEAFDAAVSAELAMDEEIAEQSEPMAALADWLTSTPPEHYFGWIDAWSEASRNPQLKAALVGHHRDCERRLARIIERLVEQGRATSADPAVDARLLTALIDGIAVQLHVLDLIDRDAADATVFSAAETPLGLATGVLAESASASLRGQWASPAPS